MLNNGLQTRKRKITGALVSVAFIAAMGSARGAQAGATTAPAKPATAQQPKLAKPAATEKKKTSAKNTQGRKASAKRPSGGQKKVAAVRARAPMAAGRRDPFREPKGGAGGMQVNEWEEVGGEPLPPGTRGLLVSQLRLEGVVREDLTNTMIAIVATNTNRAYFLRENDQIYRGMVSKITTDAIYFTMNYHDQLGEVKTHEVVARLGSAPGEGK